MPRRNRPAPPAAPRMTLSQWIEHDDGNTSRFAQPVCSTQVQALHARIILASPDLRGDAAGRLPAPLRLALAPLD